MPQVGELTPKLAWRPNSWPLREESELYSPTTCEPLGLMFWATDPMPLFSWPLMMLNPASRVKTP